MTARDFPAVAWLGVVLVLLPWSAIRSKRGASAGGGRSERTERLRALPRPSLYRLSALGMAQLFVITLLLDGLDGWTTIRKAFAFPPTGILWIVACVAAHQVISLTAMALRGLRRLPFDAGTARLLPRSRREFAGFAGLALVAGLNEEFLYRGFAPDRLVPWGLPLWLAVALATLSFGLLHGYKSLVGMLRSALVGFVLAVPVLVTGTLLPSILAHAMMDLLAGANTRPLARRLGVEIPEQAPV